MKHHDVERKLQNTTRLRQNATKHEEIFHFTCYFSSVFLSTFYNHVRCVHESRNLMFAPLTTIRQQEKLLLLLLLVLVLKMLKKDEERVKI